MESKKHFILLSSLCLILLVGISLIRFGGIKATDTASQSPDFLGRNGFDTLDFDQNDYSSSVVLSLSDEDQVEAITKGFLAVSKASVRAPSSYELNIFLNDVISPDETVQYRLSEIQHLIALNERMGWEILSDNLSFSQFAILSNRDDKMTVSIVEDYSYFITDDFADESFRRREYTFDFVKANNAWKIVRIRTNDPWEVEDNFVYQPIDLQ